MTNSNYIIITPIKNEEKYIDKVFDSVLKQSQKPSFWVIINDNSTDNSLNILEERIKDIDWIKIITKKINEKYDWLNYVKVINEGVNYFIENNIFEKLEIKYLAILDSDTEIEPEYFEKIISFFQKDDFLGVASGEIYLKRKDKWVIEKKKNVAGSARIYRLDCLKQIGFFKETPSPDTVSDIKIKNIGYKTLRIKGIKAFHHKTFIGRDLLKRYIILGRSRYILNVPILFILVLSLKIGLTEKPLIVSGIFLLIGYFSGYFFNQKKIDDIEVRNYYRNFWRRIFKK